VTVIPKDATEADIRRLYGDDSVEINAFRRFLSLVARSPVEESPGGHITRLPEDAFTRQHVLDYAFGRITGAEFLNRLDEEEARK